MAYPKQGNDTRLTLRLPLDLKARLEKKAAVERRSLNAQIVAELAHKNPVERKAA